jgi:hypothetical protein
MRVVGRGFAASENKLIGFKTANDLSPYALTHVGAIVTIRANEHEAA